MYKIHYSHQSRAVSIFRYICNTSGILHRQYVMPCNENAVIKTNKRSVMIHYDFTTTELVWPVSPFPQSCNSIKRMGEKSSTRLASKVSWKVRQPLALAAMIWSRVQFDFCLAVTGLTLTSPLGRAMKLVIHLRKGQSRTQPFAKYNVQPLIHGIWKLGSPFTFGLFENSTLC